MLPTDLSAETGVPHQRCRGSVEAGFNDEIALRPEDYCLPETPTERLLRKGGDDLLDCILPPLFW
jgi:hypothetical protein